MKYLPTPDIFLVILFVCVSHLLHFLQVVAEPDNIMHLSRHEAALTENVFVTLKGNFMRSQLNQTTLISCGTFFYFQSSFLSLRYQTYLLFHFDVIF